MTRYLLDQFGIDTKCVMSSTLNLKSRRSEMLLELCQSFGADEYVSGALGRGYLDIKLFENAGIGVSFRDYKHPAYAQMRGQEFVSHMSAVDLLFNHGPESRDILLNQAHVSQECP